MLYVVLILLVALAVVFGNAIFARLELLEAHVKRLESQRSFVMTTTMSSPTPTYTPTILPTINPVPPEHPQRRKRSPRKPK